MRGVSSSETGDVMKSKLPQLSFLLVSALASTSIYANTSSVFSPDVKRGDTSAEYRASHVPTDGTRGGEFSQRVHLQHAFNDTWRLRFISAQSKDAGEDFAFDYSRLELQQQLLESEHAGWDAALRYELQLGANGKAPDRFRIAATGKWDFTNGWQFRANLLVGKEFGSNADDETLLEARSQITAPWQGVRVGVEAFNDFNYDSGVIAYNEQDHQIGPILKVKAAGFSITASYLMGASDAADQHNFRLHVSRAIP